MFRRKFWVSLLLTLPTLAWGHMLPHALGYTAPLFQARVGFRRRGRGRRLLAPVGVVLSPAVGAALMSLSTVIVAMNAQLPRGATL